MIGQTIAHYRIVGKLGEGGMGEVYLAEDTELHRKVALKFLPKRIASDPDALARFKREARAAAALNHPNIITIHEIGHHDDRSFIAMAYIDGEMLSDELQKGLPLERALEIAVQVCQGLDKAHRAGVIHRDIKPENLLIDRDGRVKILDFGLATIGEAGAPSLEDSTGGTAHYMSPEQVRGGSADARSDVFSLGAVLYEMLAGRRPFKGEHSEAVRYSILHEEPPPLSQFNPRVTPELERIVSKTLAKDPEDRYSSAAMLEADIEALPAGRTGKRTSAKRLAIPGVLLLLAVAALIVINPFKVNISSNSGAVAGDNKIAIMYFDNMAQRGDPRRLGEIITNLLITNLSQSPDLKVVSSQRLYDILKIQGKEDAKVIDRTTASEIAKTAGARWMMLGSILQVEPHLVVTTQLVDVATGNIESSQRLTGKPGETVFELVDRMTGDTRTDLSAPAHLDVVHTRPVAEVTTNSLDAYRHYVEGLEYNQRYYAKEASESFRKALEYDSTFAMAYLEYAWSAFTEDNLKDGMSALTKAGQYIDRVSDKERLYIESAIAIMVEGKFDDGIAKLTRIVANYPDEKRAYYNLANAYFLRRDYENAIENYRKVLAIDPLHKETYNQLAYAYDYLGDFEKSIWAINEYIELAPNEANPYDSRGDLYAYNGDLEDAISSYLMAVRIKPDFLSTVAKVGNIYVYKRQYEKAESQYRILLARDEAADRSRGRLYLTTPKLYQGRLNDALAELDAAIAADEREGYTAEQYIFKFYTKAEVLIALGQYDRAHAAARRFRDLAMQVLPQFSAFIEFSYAGLCADAGRVAEADSVIRPYEAVLDTLEVVSAAAYHLARGDIALKRNVPEIAIQHLESSNRLDPQKFTTRYRLAEAYLMGHRINDAISILEKILHRYDNNRLSYACQSVLAHYQLGTAYQQAGRKEDAIEQFETFLELWKDADPVWKEIPDAKKRLEQLTRSS
jgi:serine/threonine protein kinase/tetratricopeptide (TPR) repeat protein